MKETKHLYNNHFGMAFYWKKENEILMNKVQLIFRDTGFYFTKHELHQFKECVEESILLNQCCDECELKNQCYKYLLKTPCNQIDLVLPMQELHAVKDLIEGTLFKMNLEDYLYGEGVN